MEQFDVILIGTGQATGTMLPELLDMGRKIAIVEAGRVGGTCVNWGCTPTKTMVASARAAHMVRRAGDFGIDVPDFTINFERVKERVDAIRDNATESFEQWLRDTTTFFRGVAEFEDPHTIRIVPTDRDGTPNGEESITIAGDTIYIHTGATASVPDVPGVDSIPFLDNKGILALGEVPEHLIVVGGSYIGLEFGQAFARFGSRVTVIQRAPRIMSREDDDVAEEATRILEGEGIEILCGSSIRGFAKTPDGVLVEVERDWGSGKQTRSVSGSHVLLATGRVPQSASLRLEAAGVETDERGFIRVNEVLQTSAPHIYALGDVNGNGAFTHTSVHDGLVVTRNLRGDDWKWTDRIPIYAMYIDPPLARVGMNEIQARASRRPVLQAVRPMSEINRAREKDETAGLVKILVDAETHEILGATIFGVGGDEIINMIASWMYTGRPYTDMQRAVLAHPTVAELLPWILNDLKPLDQT